MKIAKLSDMKRGWFVGDFEPTLYKTRDCEVAVKYFRAGESVPSHYHKKATEITVIVSGCVETNGIRFNTGDIIIKKPEEIADFVAIEDTSCAVVKLPGIPGDKYPVE